MCFTEASDKDDDTYEDHEIFQIPIEKEVIQLICRIGVRTADFFEKNRKKTCTKKTREFVRTRFLSLNNKYKLEQNVIEF